MCARVQPKSNFHSMSWCGISLRINDQKKRKPASSLFLHATLPVVFVRLAPLPRALLPSYRSFILFFITTLGQVLFKAPFLIVVPVLAIAHLPYVAFGFGPFEDVLPHAVSLQQAVVEVGRDARDFFLLLYVRHEEHTRLLCLVWRETKVAVWQRLGGVYEQGMYRVDMA